MHIGTMPRAKFLRTMVERLIMGTLNAMQKDPSKTLGLTSKLKALALAAAGLERLHDLKFRALGLDKNANF